MKGKWLALFLGIAVAAAIYYMTGSENKKLDQVERSRLGGTYITLSKGVTHYSLTGPPGGNLVVLLHGGTIPMWTWDSQTAFLSGAGFRVLNYDQYGRGYSDRPHVVYDQELYKNQLLELVEKLGLDQQFDLIGLSVGGGTAVNFTAHYPDMVGRLILISPLIDNFKLPAIFQIPVVGEAAARLVGIKTIQKRFKSLIQGNPDEKKYTMLFKEQTTYKGFQRSLLSMLRNDAVRDYTTAYRKLGAQKRDILLIRGNLDTEITEEMIQKIRFLVPGILFKPIEGAGHGVVSQKPGIINRLIIDFLRG